MCISGSMVCELCGTGAGDVIPCADVTMTATMDLIGSNKQDTQLLNTPDDFLSICNSLGFESPNSDGVTCDSVEVVNTITTDGLSEQRLTLTVGGLIATVDTFVNAAEADGLDIMVYGEYSIYVTDAPTGSPADTETEEENPVDTEPTVAPPSTTEGQAMVTARCTDFQTAGTDDVLYTDLTDLTNYSCAQKLTIATPEERSAMLEAHGPSEALYVFGATAADSEALKASLQVSGSDVYYLTVTSLGGIDNLLSTCSCREVVELDIESADYANEVAGAVVFAILAVLCVCGFCYVIWNRKDYFPDKEVEAFEEKDYEAVGGATEDKANFVENKIFDTAWVPDEDDMDGGHTAI